MKLVLNINKSKGWNKKVFKNNTLIYKGYINNFKINSIFNQLIKNNFDINKNLSFIKKIDGHFSIIFFNRYNSLIITDRVSSIPLMIKEDANKLILADSYKNMLKALKFEKIKIEVDAFQAKHFAMTGYTFGQAGLYKDFLLTYPGSFYISKKNKLKKISYFDWVPFKIYKKSNLGLDKKLKLINNNVIKKLIKSSNNRHLVIPLSAGYDSRFILSGLIEHGYKNIITFSYGRENNREADTAKKIAKFLNIPWNFIKFTNSFQKNLMLSKEYKNYKDFSDVTSSIHFPQDFFAVKKLKDKKIIPSNSIIVNGQTGDFISGNHIQYEKKIKFNQILDLYFNKHYKIWKSIMPGNSNLMKEKIKKRLENFNIEFKNIPNVLNGLQKLEYENRQAKYVMAGQRAYEYLGFEWRLPLWDLEYLDFWENLELKQKIKQSLYKKVLLEQNWANVWHSFPINPKTTFSPAKSLLRFIFKCIFLPIGKDKWHKFELQFLDYFLSNLCGYAPWSYIKVASDNRGFSSALSWHTEEYLNEKGLMWNGLK